MIKGDIRLSRFWQRLLGLSPMGGIGESYRGWVFIPACCSIHTFTLRRPIDLEWLDREGRVLKREFLVPPRSIRCCPHAYGVRERYSDQGLRKQEGWGATETIIALPLLLMIFFMTIQLAYIAIAKVHLGHVLREGMRAAAAELTAPNILSSSRSAQWTVDGVHSQQPVAGLDRQRSANHAFEDAIQRAFRAWAVFYGESQSEGSRSIRGADFRVASQWLATLESGQMPDRAGGLKVSPGSQSASNDPMLFATEPDHLKGVLSYKLPLKLPFFGRSLAQVLPVSPDCNLATKGSGLCVEGGRWYWWMQARARIPIPATAGIEAFQTGQEASQTNHSKPYDQSEAAGDSTDVTKADARQFSLSAEQAFLPSSPDALPQTIAALITELQAVTPTASERSHQVIQDCGIQFGT